MVSGYITGIQLANRYGFTTQNPSCYEVCSNEASTKQRKVDVDGRQIIVYKPVVEVSKENRGEKISAKESCLCGIIDIRITPFLDGGF